jgi:hypothetical protein
MSGMIDHQSSLRKGEPFMYFINLFQKYYMRLNESNWDEIYNPHFATSFSTKTEAHDWIVKHTNLLEYAVPVPAEESLIKYDEWMKSGGIRRTFAFVNNDLSRKYNNENAEEVLKWRLAIDSDNIRYEDYKTWPGLNQKFENLYTVEKFHNREYTETYLSIKLFFKKSSKFETFKKELDLVLPSVTRIEDGYKLFSVFDRFLSEGGNSVDFCYLSDEKCKVTGRWDSVIEGSLKECFDYLLEERFYDYDND